MNPIDASIYLSMGIALEAAAYPKPGNVHRLRDIKDIRFEDFIITSLIFQKFLCRGVRRGRIIEKLKRRIFGDLIYNIVYESINLHGGGNVCLGTAMLLVPISISLGYLYRKQRKPSYDAHEIVKYATFLLRKYSTVMDTILLYRIIRLISPSYIKDTDETGKYPNVYLKNYQRILLYNNIRLWDVLVASSKRDLISYEITNSYSLTIASLEFLTNKLSMGIDWNNAVVDTYIYILSKKRDTIVLREYGRGIMDYIGDIAGEILRHGGSASPKGYKLLVRLDRELSEMNINPGSSADVTATAISLYTLTKKRNIIR